jgi:hypothetical protein
VRAERPLDRIPRHIRSRGKRHEFGEID